MKIRESYFLIGILFISVSFWSCKKEKIAGEGAVVTKVFDVKNFYSVQIKGNSSLSVTNGTEFRVEARGYENILEKLQTKVTNGALIIQFDPNVNISNDNAEIFITMPSLISLTSTGNSIINISGGFIGMDVFTIAKTGKGDVTVSNTSATNFKLTLDGESNFKGFGLESENAIVTVNGIGNAEISASKNLNATINGSGNIYYQGNPEVKTKISGTGEVIKK